MARLSKDAERRHAAAMALVDEGRALTLPEREKVLEDYREDAQHLNGRAGAFFTPEGLARDLALHLPDGVLGGAGRVLDLCAGIGRIADAVGFADERGGFSGATEIVCVEMNPNYLRVGRAVVPRATWIQADVFDVAAYRHLGPFDCVISNPPFGRIKVAPEGWLGRYTGGLFEYRLIELASTLARYGVFIIPQGSAPFAYSGKRSYTRNHHGPADIFEKITGIALGDNCGVDTAAYADEWNGTSPKVEIVVCDFAENAASAKAPSLFPGLPCAS